jgi:hypothetical protein
MPGEEVVIYSNGFGPTSVPVTSRSITQSGTLSPLPVIQIGRGHGERDLRWTCRGGGISVQRNGTSVARQRGSTHHGDLWRSYYTARNSNHHPQLNLPLFRQEYLCEFVDSDDYVFPRDLIERAVTPDVRPLFG